MKIFNDLTQTAKFMIYSLLILFVVFIVLAFIVNSFYLFEPMKKFSLGLATGILVSIYKVISMDRSINKLVDMEEEAKAKLKSQSYFILRYFITFGYAALVIIFKDYIGVFGAVIGLFSLKFSAHMANQFLIREEKKLEK